MCKLCDKGIPQSHSSSRRDFLKASAATGVAAAGLDLFAARPAAADSGGPPKDLGQRGRRYVIRDGSVMSMDPQVGDFAQADVLIEGKKILAVGPKLKAGDAAVIDARGRIVMPGFIDTHHHQFETALRSFLADGLLLPDGTPGGVDQLLPIHPANVRPGVPSEGRLHQRAVRFAQPARRRCHDGARHLADPSLARALGRRDPGDHGFGPPCRVRLFRERGRRSRQRSIRTTRAASRSSGSLPTTSSSP